MSYKPRATFKTETDGKFTAGSDKWTGQEMEDMGQDLADSVQWLNSELVLTDAATVNWDYSLSDEAVVTIAGNRTLSINNIPSGRVSYGTLRVIQNGTGGFTLTLPAGKNNGGSINTAPNSESLIMFRHNGSGFTFMISQVF